MPDGRVMRIDDDRQCAYIVRRGRTYEAPLSEVESAARVPNARVLFDLVREHGKERAGRVRLRRGTRTNKRQRRFGDLTGARRPGAKARVASHAAYGIDVTTQPFRVVRAWVEALADDDVDGAVSLYLPSAVVHAEDRQLQGRRDIGTALERSPWFGADPASVELHGSDVAIRVDALSGEEALTTYLVVESGRIVEHWLDGAPEVEPIEEEDRHPVEFERRGDVPDSAVDYARHRLDQLFEGIGEPVSSAHMKLQLETNPLSVEPARADGVVELGGVGGPIMRAHASAPGLNEAIDVAMGRLASRLEHHRDRERHKATGRPAETGEWRHGNLPTPHPPFFDRPPAEREVVRHKTFAPADATVEEAAFDLSLLDYDFYLFVELATGADSLLEVTDEGLVLHQVAPDGGAATGDTPDLPGADGVDGLQRSDQEPPTLRVSEAIDYLDQAGLRFLFYANAVTGRGNVIYRRYDGHYGLITPTLDDEEL